MPEDKEFELAMQLLEKARSIYCPHCHEKQSIECVHKHTTYWGEPEKYEDQEETCSKCNKEFIVKETVERVFTSEPKEEE